MNCIYCNEVATALDHYVPVSFTSIRKACITYRKNVSKTNTVNACRDCNIALGNVLIFNIEDRAKHIIKKRLKEFNKEITAYEWTEEEIEKEDFRMQQMLRFKLQERDRAVRRFNHLRSVASGEKYAVAAESA